MASPEEVLRRICRILWPNNREIDDKNWDCNTCDQIADELAGFGYGREADPNECGECDGSGLNDEGRMVRATGGASDDEARKLYPCSHCQGTGIFLEARGEKDSS